MTDLLVSISSYVEFHTLESDIIVALAIAALLLLCSGFASGSEIAFFSLTPKDLDELDPDKFSADAKVKELREDSERTLATILILNNLVNVTIILLCNYIINKLVTFKAEWLELLCVTVLLTFILLLFGEIMPKVYSRINPLSFCRRGAGALILLRKFFLPLEFFLLKSGAFAGRVIEKESHQLSVGELEQALELTDQDDLKEEQSMLRGIIRFGDETAKEIMTSRQDIVALDIRSTYAEVLQSIIDNNYSRIPVYQDSIDNVRGILYIKDLLPHLSKASGFRWQSLTRPPYFVPETKKIDDLLRDFQANKVHIATVVDEFGGTSGIVTLEDILEEIVGEINDEFDEDENTYARLNANTYLFEGKTLLSDFTKILKIDDEEFAEIEGEADSLAGLLLELKGNFPIVHEQITYKNYLFEVLELDGRRISKIKVTVRPIDDDAQ
ncbi:MAG: gliding motility-associated protein GldE [Prevotella bivia]|nr:gliding motility-associated protein GldE [Prevotella bivia]